MHENVLMHNLYKTLILGRLMQSKGNTKYKVLGSYGFWKNI